MPSSACKIVRPSPPTPCPYTTLFRSGPLTVISGWMNVLLGAGPGLDAATLAKALAAIGRGVAAQGRLLSDLLDHSRLVTGRVELQRDRKSTRLNSSHLVISYAVFCLQNRTSLSSYTLSLHDALPIWAPHRHLGLDERAAGGGPWPGRGHPGQGPGRHRPRRRCTGAAALGPARPLAARHRPRRAAARSEEHTSELQSPCNLVCRLLLAKSYVPLLLHPVPTRRSSDLGPSPSSRAG